MINFDKASEKIEGATSETEVNNILRKMKGIDKDAATDYARIKGFKV